MGGREATELEGIGPHPPGSGPLTAAGGNKANPRAEVEWKEEGVMREQELR